MILADYHMHTSFSTDSEASVRSMVEAAISKGLTRCCITDHMDYLYPSQKAVPPLSAADAGGKEKKEFEFDVEAYFTTLLQYREEYRDRISLEIGVELGLRNEPEIKEEVQTYYQRLLSEYPFDFVIGSSHVLAFSDPYFNDFWTTRTGAQGRREYFASIGENVLYYNGFQVYGHLDYIDRCLHESERTSLSAEDRELIDTGLRRMMERGIGIECNTSGYAHGLPGPHPCIDILKRYRELGGEIITIGSDAHRPEQISGEFRRAEALLQELGFRYYTVFRERKAEFLPL